MLDVTVRALVSPVRSESRCLSGGPNLHYFSVPGQQTLYFLPEISQRSRPDVEGAFDRVVGASLAQDERRGSPHTERNAVREVLLDTRLVLATLQTRAEGLTIEVKPGGVGAELLGSERVLVLEEEVV